MSGVRVEVVQERHRATMPEIEYFQENREAIQSYAKDERARQDRALDDADFHLSRKRHKRPDGITRHRIWPRPSA